MKMPEKTLDELRKIQKDTGNWKENIDKVAAKLDEDYPVKVNAKALWILGEMGLKYPQEIESYVAQIASFIKDDDAKLRERSLNALGRIGRANKDLIIPYFDELMNTRNDENGKVRLAFVWACENIATNAPELFCDRLAIFYEMIDDSYEKVRIESPEMFRVMGKRKPECVKPYLEKLQYIADNDEHPVVRIHCAGAVRITENAMNKND
ncbi:sister chromatid cohesion protein PDS5 [Methanobrevibacter sp.]|uniref:sister chromatid cohesion protein PDS5 n=1 Tax=Methanobrevibacter sp. TaxID=66852 RepID=UPI00388DEBB4